MPVTQLSPLALPGRRYGSFSGRAPTPPVSVPITQLQPGGWGGRRYGSFAGRAGSTFPTQFAGLRTFYGGVVVDLCLVAESDAPGSMGGVLKLDKNGTLYAVYLVDPSDPNASSVRIETTTGVQSVRLKT